MKRPARRTTTDADLTPKQIQRQIETLQGEIEHHRGMRENAQNDSYRVRSMRAIDARHALIQRLQRLPQYKPMLPMDLPPVHAARSKDFPKLTE